ncbi:ALF repeat-containing protein [Kitasatospora sp. NPDC057940]|uniref:ALF repeat-containing protein n=1 Tax=Kitasatospora sp. NPDC057940 TaxID=3346285 RepID=UPI0036DA45A2
MKLPRVSAVVAAAVLAPTVLFPSMASAADNPQPAGVSGPDTASKGAEDQATGQEEHDRAEVRRVLADKESGPGVREAAQKALNGTAADLRHFLDVELHDQRVIDNRVRAYQVLAVGGPAVKKAATAALRGGTAEDVAKFLKEGQFIARAEDEARAKVQSILDDKETGPGVRAAGEKALAGTVADVRHFLDVELGEWRQTDNRLKVVRISDGAGPALSKAADKALRGSYQDILDFLKEGQFTARAEDEDRAKVQSILDDKETGPAVHEAAQKALAGTAADVRHFLDVELDERRQTDNRVMVARIFDGAGPAVKAAARKAISGSNQEVLAFLKEGQFIARAEDEARAKVQGILDDKETGPGVREAGEKALAGTVADVRHFLDVELPKQRADDNRVKLAQIMSAGGRAVREAASRALDGTDEDVVKFLKEGQFTARAEDEAANKPAPQPARPAEQPQTATGAQPAVQPAALTTTTGTTAGTTTGTTTTGTTAGTATATTGATTVTTRPGQLAATGTEGLGWEAGGAAAALAAGAALVVASRRRSTES